VICEIMREDGTMARFDDCVAFARQHGVKMATIRDLIAYRRKHDRMVSLKSESTFTSRFGGDWAARAYFNKATGEENLVLVKGRIDPTTPRWCACTPPRSSPTCWARSARAPTCCTARWKSSAKKARA
jgi:3,4-dihydroxy 2-butanone 4-phosphate synthase/GTP cyclohydrolase II